jgi:hypothetical protein
MGDVGNCDCYENMVYLLNTFYEFAREFAPFNTLVLQCEVSFTSTLFTLFYLQCAFMASCLIN